MILEVLLLAQIMAVRLPGTDANTPKTELKCGRYQHVEHWPSGCGPVPCDATACYSVCTTPPPDKCVDDMHEVTERDWQTLMDRLAALEAEPKQGQVVMK
jgi:hypothetical protein